MADDLKPETATDGNAAGRAMWHTPILEVLDIASETEVAPGPGPDFSSLS